MAISTPTERYAQSRTAQGATTTFPLTGTIATGSFCVLGVTTSVDGKVVSSVSDGAGNTWSVDVAFNGIAANENISIISCQVTTQMTPGTTITVNYAVSTNNQAHLWLEEFTGIATSSAFDQTAAASGSSTSPSTGASGTLAQADELVVAWTRNASAVVFTKGATYTDMPTASLGSNRSNGEYKIVAATTAVTADGSLASSDAWTIALATYKGAAAGSAIKTIDGLAKASIKTINGLAIASVKTRDGLA